MKPLNDHDENGKINKMPLSSKIATQECVAVAVQSCIAKSVAGKTKIND